MLQEPTIYRCEEFIVTLQENFRQTDLEKHLEIYNQTTHSLRVKKAACEFYAIGEMLVLLYYRDTAVTFQRWMSILKVPYRPADYC